METEFYPLGDGIGKLSYLDHMGDDLRVTNVARSSFGKWNDTWGPRDEKVMGILTEGSITHWSPFAHPQLSIMVKAPISLQRQFFKHNIGLVHNSESTRYVELKEEFYIPTKLRYQSRDRKQGSAHQFESDELTGRITDHYTSAMHIYRKLLRQGVSRELARDVLPMATYTTWVTTGSLAAFARIYNQRTKEGAQREIEQYARAIGRICEQIWPIAWRALTSEKAPETSPSPPPG